MRAMVVSLGLLLAVATMPAIAGESVVLVIDRSAYRIEPFLATAWMEPLSPDGKVQIWRDPEGRDGFSAIPVMIGGTVTVMGSDNTKALRYGQIAPLTAAFGREDDVAEWLDPVITAAMTRNGLDVEKKYRARSVNYEVVAASPERPETQRAFAFQMDGFPLVGLSWDNRRVLVSFELKSYLRARGKRKIERERSTRVVRYASLPAPADADPLMYWSQDGASRFRAEVERAFNEGIDVAVSGEWPEDNDLRRKDTVVVPLDDGNAIYRGRVLKRTPQTLQLLHHDDSITLVRIAP
jgi:hypothetical protein